MFTKIPDYVATNWRQWIPGKGKSSEATSSEDHNEKSDDNILPTQSPDTSSKNDTTTANNTNDVIAVQCLNKHPPMTETSKHESDQVANDDISLELHTSELDEQPTTDTELNVTKTFKKLPFYRGGVRPRHRRFVRFIGRCGFIAKGVVYGIIGVLTITNVSGTWTPNGSAGNESPQGAFLLLGGIPAIGRPILVVMAVGLVFYILWRWWESITGQGMDAASGKKGNFFRYRLSPFVSGCVYTAYFYYVVQMIYQTEDEQQQLASSKEFPASWTKSGIGRAGIGILGIAFIIACITQLVNAITGNFIPDLRTSEPGSRKWEAFIVHWSGRIGFGGRAIMFGTMSGFFWDSLAKRNESGRQNMVAAAISKLANASGGKFFMVILGLGLIIYALFAISNAYYKYFPTPPPSRRPLYALDEDEALNFGISESRTYTRPPVSPRPAAWKFWRRHNSTPVPDEEKAQDERISQSTPAIPTVNTTFTR